MLIHTCTHTCSTQQNRVHIHTLCALLSPLPPGSTYIKVKCSTQGEHGVSTVYHEIKVSVSVSVSVSVLKVKRCAREYASSARFAATTLPYPTLPYLVTLPYPTLPYLILPYPTLPYLTLSSKYDVEEEVAHEM